MFNQIRDDDRIFLSFKDGWQKIIIHLWIGLQQHLQKDRAVVGVCFIIYPYIQNYIYILSHHNIPFSPIVDCRFRKTTYHIFTTSFLYFFFPTGINIFLQMSYKNKLLGLSHSSGLPHFRQDDANPGAMIQWEFQDPKMEVLYHIRPYFVGYSLT